MSIDRILAGQSGLITRGQALEAGLTPAEVDRRVRVRRWRPVHPRVYLAAGHRSDAETRVRAAMLWAGQDAVLCGAAAAWWHGLVERAPATLSITVPRRGPTARPAVHLRRRVLTPPDVTACRGLTVTTRPLTLLEAAIELGADGTELLDRGLRGSIRFPAVHDAFRRHPSPAAAALLAAAATRSAPVAVRLLHRLLRGAGVTGWQPAASGAEFPALTVTAVGWAWHPTGPALTGPASTGPAPMRTALCFTWHDFTERPSEVVDVICTTSGRVRSTPSGAPRAAAT